MQGRRDERRGSAEAKTVRTVPQKGKGPQKAAAAKRVRRSKKADRKMAAMVFVTVVLLFFSCRSVWKLIASEKSPDAAQAAGMEAGDSSGGIGPMHGDIVTLAENLGDQAGDSVQKRGILVAIDPGHGGYDNGSNIDGIYEQEITLDISLLLADKLKAMGYDTLLLREDNETHLFPEERVEKAEKAKADLYISIHVNTFDSDTSVSRLETWYCEDSVKSEQLARLVQNRAAEAAEAKDRGLKETDELIVIRDAAMPSCLVETGFLTNRAERMALVSKDYQEKLAQGIAQGIDEFVGLQEGAAQGR